MGASVDFVVVGFGLSALLMLGGFALRDLGPWLFGSSADPAMLPEFEDAKGTIRKQTLTSIGNAVSIAGAGVAVVTVAALLGKTTDEIGGIVVGMSLVLAAVGVGAWSYDSIRRYRSAMDIVTTQEQSVRSRIQAREARNRSLRPGPATTPKPNRKARPEPARAEPADTTTTHAPDSAADQEHDDEHEIDLDAPLPGWHDGPTTVSPTPEPEITPAVVTTVEPERTQPEDGPEPETTPIVGTRTTPRPRTVSTTTSTTTTQPPAMALDDALLDEAVRVEPAPRFASRGGAPSWLFDDLDTELDQHGSPSDDPVDRFHAAKPVSRPSALDRLLADDDENDDDSSEDKNR
jgi:hypothetical protein